MSKLLGDALTSGLLDHLRTDPAKLEGEVIILLTVDSKGWPHAALLSPWEVYGTDSRNVKVATYGDSTSTANLRRSGLGTLIVFNSGKTYYVKGSVVTVVERMRSDPSNTLFNFKVSAVMEDSIPGVGVAGPAFEGDPGEQHGPLHAEMAAQTE